MLVQHHGASSEEQRLCKGHMSSRREPKGRPGAAALHLPGPKACPVPRGQSVKPKWRRAGGGAPAGAVAVAVVPLVAVEVSAKKSGELCKSKNPPVLAK